MSAAGRIVDALYFYIGPRYCHLRHSLYIVHVIIVLVLYVFCPCVIYRKHEEMIQKSHCREVAPDQNSGPA